MYKPSTEIYLINTKVNLDTLLGLQKIEVPRIFRKSALKNGKVVSPNHRPPLPSRIYP
jgi:hypothetical protein